MKNTAPTNNAEAYIFDFFMVDLLLARDIIFNFGILSWGHPYASLVDRIGEKVTGKVKDRAEPLEPEQQGETGP